MTSKRIAVEFEDDPGRSVPLSFDLSCPPALSSFCEWCVAEVLRFYGMEHCRPTTKEKTKEAVDLVLANLIKARRISRRCFVGISRSPNDYTKTRYRQRRISFPNLRRVLQWMTESDPPYSSFIGGFLDERGDVIIGFVSRYKATNRLLMALERYRI
jgi:hypothetical protein